MEVRPKPMMSHFYRWWEGKYTKDWNKKNCQVYDFDEARDIFRAGLRFGRNEMWEGFKMNEFETWYKGMVTFSRLMGNPNDPDKAEARKVYEQQQAQELNRRMRDAAETYGRRESQQEYLGK